MARSRINVNLLGKLLVDSFLHNSHRQIPLFRDEHAVKKAVQETVDKFGGIDICINNASAISLTGTAETPMKRLILKMISIFLLKHLFSHCIHYAVLIIYKC